jgi:AcrR family transcriptional regulator
METQILLKATELFLERGFKTVTMDDIASALSISKKTIYQHYASKPELIEKSLTRMNTLILEQLEFTVKKGYPAIQELFEAHQNIHKALDININASSPLHELTKYYPKIDQKQKKFYQKKVVHFVETNLEKGMREGVFRSNLDIDFLARFFIASNFILEDLDFFPAKQFDSQLLDELQMKYYMRAIATEKGLKEFDLLCKRHY